VVPGSRQRCHDSAGRYFTSHRNPTPHSRPAPVTRSKAPTSTSGASVGRPCAQMSNRRVPRSRPTSCAHTSLLSTSPNMMAERQALELSSAGTRGGCFATPAVASSSCRYNYKKGKRLVGCHVSWPSVNAPSHGSQLTPVGPTVHAMQIICRLSADCLSKGRPARGYLPIRVLTFRSVAVSIVSSMTGARTRCRWPCTVRTFQPQLQHSRPTGIKDVCMCRHCSSDHWQTIHSSAKVEECSISEHLSLAKPPAAHPEEYKCKSTQAGKPAAASHPATSASKCVSSLASSGHSVRRCGGESGALCTALGLPSWCSSDPCARCPMVTAARNGHGVCVSHQAVRFALQGRLHIYCSLRWRQLPPERRQLKDCHFLLAAALVFKAFAVAIQAAAS